MPNEMILEIWGNIQAPGDIESFALVSKHVYAIGKPFVEEHKKLRKDFAFIEIGHEMNIDAPASLLKKVLFRPRMALYVTHLSFGRIQYVWDDPSDDTDGSSVGDEWPNNGHVPYPDVVMALFIETIQKLSFVPQDETRCWIKRIRTGNEDPIFTLLCTLLPNLTMVTLRDAGFHAKILEETILRIAEAGKTMFLTRLVTVNIVCTPEDHTVDVWLTAFAALPSVQSIHIDQMCIDEVNDDGVDNASFFASDSYSIRELTFTNSGLHPKILVQLLDRVKGLKVFSYVDPNEACHAFKPFWIRVALQANAKHSLEYLAILPFNSNTEEWELLGSLRGFSALKELETNLHLLCRESEWHRVPDLLPSSIEKLYLDSSDYMPDYGEPRVVEEGVVEEIVKAKSRLIPNLKALELRPCSDIIGNRSMIEPLEEKCQSVGIELTLIED